MHILLIVFGVLLMLFGGGCTLILGGLMVTDPASFANDIGTILPYWLPLGLAPLVGGALLMRAGLRRDRTRRAAPGPES